MTSPSHPHAAQPARPDALQASLKSAETEEWLDVHFTRPIGLLWARFFIRLGWHPNAVTLLSIVLGVAAAVCFYFDSVAINAVGIALLVQANLFDSTDGQMARLTGKKTRWGRILDGFAGDAWFFSIYFALCMRLQGTLIPFTSVHWGVGIWLTCAVVGFVFHARQCQLADYYRNIHLFYLKGTGGSELDRSEALQREFRETRWRDRGAWKLFLVFYIRYTRAQEQMSPTYQRLRGYALNPAQRERFLQGSRPLMKYTNLLTFNTRAIALYVSLLVGEPLLYLLFESVVLNALLAYMRARHERLCRQLLSEVDGAA